MQDDGGEAGGQEERKYFLSLVLVTSRFVVDLRGARGAQGGGGGLERSASCAAAI